MQFDSRDFKRLVWSHQEKTRVLLIPPVFTFHLFQGIERERASDILNLRYTHTQEIIAKYTQLRNKYDLQIEYSSRKQKQKVYEISTQYIYFEDKRFAKGTETCLLFTVHYSYLNKGLPLRLFQKTAKTQDISYECVCECVFCFLFTFYCFESLYYAKAWKRYGSKNTPQKKGIIKLRNEKKKQNNFNVNGTFFRLISFNKPTV